MCVRMIERERETESKRERECVCVYEREILFEDMRVGDRKRGGVCVCVCLSKIGGDELVLLKGHPLFHSLPFPTFLL